MKSDSNIIFSKIIHDLNGMRGFYVNLHYDINYVFEDYDYIGNVEIKEVTANYELLRLLIYLNNSKLPSLSIEINVVDNEYVLKNVKKI
jgi:hypothetical protein